MPPLDPLFKLLDDFKRLPPIPRERRTFLQIIQCAEIHWSNILAFFLDPNEVHDMDSLFLDALLKGHGCGPLSNVEVEREHHVPATATMRGGRIDLFIKSNQYLIAVENKIDAQVFGDQLKRQSVYINRRASEEDLEPVKILLTLKPPPPPDKLYGFSVLRYESLIDRLARQKGDSYYMVLKKDLLETTRKRLKGSSVMKPVHIKFFRVHTKEIMGFLDAIDKFRGVLRTKTSELQDLMDLGHSNVKRVPVIAAQAIKLKAIDARLRYEVSLKSGPKVQPARVRVFAVISADGWKFQFKRFGHTLTLEKLRTLLHHCFPQVKFKEDGNSFFEAKKDGAQGVTVNIFPFDAKLPTVQKHYKQLIGELATNGSAALQNK
jgi:hypothetical protein